MRPEEERFWGTVAAVLAVYVLIGMWYSLMLALGHG